MKKYWMIIMALALVIALVVGCAPKEPPTGLDAAEITVQVEKEWMAYYEAAAKRITDANSGVTIKLQEIGFRASRRSLDRPCSQRFTGRH